MTSTFLFCLTIVSLGAGESHPLTGYDDYDAYLAKTQKLAEDELATATALGVSDGDREIVLLTLSRGEAKNKPAILIVGGVYAPHVAGSEYALRMAKQLVKAGKKAGPIRTLLTDYTIYVIPRPSPDATEKNFASPVREHVGNERSTDDDRDFTFGEDPCEDLNEDGFITQMRVRDDAGEWITHPEDDRLMIKADAKKGERGRYRLLTEGVDNDGDDQWNEDAGDGVSFNRNFPFKYDAFGAAAGANQASEVETRVVADFAFDHPEIAWVLSFTPEDNLLKPWKHDANKDKLPEKRSVQSADVAGYEAFSSLYKEQLKPAITPNAPAGHGSFSEWAYFHFGRFSLAARGWHPLYDKFEEAPEFKDKREIESLQRLAQIDVEQSSAFIDWKAIDHPDFPNKRVEVGGFKPLIDLNPPAARLDEIAEKHVAFLLEAAKRTPKIVFRNSEITSLGGGIYRIETTLINIGDLASICEMGKITRTPYPLQLKIETPEGATFLKGHSRTTTSVLAPFGGSHKQTWIIRTDAAEPTFRLHAYAPMVKGAKIALPEPPPESPPTP